MKPKPRIVTIVTVVEERCIWVEADERSEVDFIQVTMQA